MAPHRKACQRPPLAVLEEPELNEHKTVAKVGEVVVGSFGLSQSCRRSLKDSETRATAIDLLLKAIGEKGLIDLNDVDKGLMHEAHALNGVGQSKISRHLAVRAR